MITLAIPANLRSLRIVGPWISATLEYGGEAERETLLPKLELTLQEICVNVVNHAYDDGPDGRIKLYYQTAGSTHRYTVTDTGARYDPAGRPAVDLDTPTVGGYGLFLVDSLADELTYERLGGENRWTLVFHRSTQVAT